MKKLLKIAKLELSTLFYSPIAWIILVIFAVHCGVIVTDLLEAFNQSLTTGRGLGSLNDEFFTDTWRGFFINIRDALYLYIPLLTMGLLSREYKSGTIKLLYSSPVSVGQIVGGKFLAMMGYGALLIATLAGFSFAGGFSFIKMDIGMAVAGLLGLYLLICAYASIGLFMSSLTPYQLVAAISTLVVLAILNYVGGIGQGIEFVRDLTYFLSISGRVDSFLKGLIVSRDTIYFVLVIFMFLGLTYFKMKSDRESRSHSVRIAQYASLLVVVLLIGYITSRPVLTYYFDATVNQRRTITETSKEIIQQLKRGSDEPVKMTTYVNLTTYSYRYGVPSARNQDRRRFERYIRFLPRLQMNYVYYYDNPGDKQMVNGFPDRSLKEIAKQTQQFTALNFDEVLSPSEIQSEIDLESEENRFVRKLEHGGRTAFLRIFDDMMRHPSEREITAALKRLSHGAINIAFIQDHGERQIDYSGDRHYKHGTVELPYRYSMINHGFEPDSILIDREQIPEETDILVIADPQKEYSSASLEKIKKYINQGGNLLIAGEPTRQSLVNSISEIFNIRLINNKLVEENKQFSDEFVLSSVADEAINNESGETIFDKQNPVGMPGPGIFGTPVSTPGVTGIAGGDRTALVANGASYEKNNSALLEAKDTLKSVKATAVGFTRSTNGDRKQRVMVLGDADFMSNAELTRGNVATSNLNFMYEVFKWLSYDRFPVQMDRPGINDGEMVIGKSGIFVIRIISLGVFPALIVFGGGMLLYKRRKK